MELIMKKYNTPEIKLVSFDIADVITLSVAYNPQELELDLELVL